MSCQTNEKNTILKQDINLNGNWEYSGFGKGITFTDSIVKSYHLTTAGNVRLSDDLKERYLTYFTVDTLSNDTILLKDGVKTFKLFRSNQNFEAQVDSIKAKDPVYNFEVLWHTFNENYCYFKERSIDWDAMYLKYKSQVTKETTPLQLYLVFEEMLSDIDDSHISMDVPNELEEVYAAQKVSIVLEDDEENIGELERKVKNLIIDKHVKNPKRFNQNTVTYGTVNEGIGYIQIENMVAMAYYDISKDLSKDEFWKQWWANLNKAKNYHEDVRIGTGIMMDSIVKDLGEMTSIIIDLRFNGGGFDDASIEILNHFVNKETPIVNKKVKFGDGFTEKQLMTLVPSKNRFKGQLYVLTSHQTASAAELFVLGAKEIPNAQLVGATTEGVFSDILDKKLPNGWTYGLSNMIYESMEGVSYENIGISPDITLNYPKEYVAFYNYMYEEIQDGDDAIETVISINKE
jgi:hypothetical protein